MLMKKEKKEKKKEDMLRQKSNNPNLKGGEQYTFSKNSNETRRNWGICSGCRRRQ